MKYLLLAILSIVLLKSQANLIPADPSNYTNYLSTLMPDDTLLLAEGNYMNRLNIFSIEGNQDRPIVIMGSGDGTVFLGNACCNTVSLKACAYIVIRDFKLDGLNINYIDGIKAEGTSGNWTHHITIDNITIDGHGSNQQTVGISTKCPSWDWEIRNCRINGAGTGLYLGNSNGQAPFVNGLVEYNVVKNTIGYNMQIKHQNVGSRNIPGMRLEGKTIIRHNVFSKENNASSGGSARPNLLVSNFPASGDGVDDYYEIYSNFFWQNPTESLFQGTGNIAFYDNICFNDAGGNGIGFQSHNGFKPRNIYVFHNTVICETSWGIRLLDTDPNYQKHLYGNAVFSNHSTPIRIVGGGQPTADLSENIIDVLDNVNNYVIQASNDIARIDLYPSSGSRLNSTMIPYDLFNTFTDYNKDFNLKERTWNYRGAYSGEGANEGWKLAISRKTIDSITVGIEDNINTQMVLAYPNPTSAKVYFSIPFDTFTITVYDSNGHFQSKYTNQNSIDFSGMGSGVYMIEIKTEHFKQTLRIIRQ